MVAIKQSKKVQSKTSPPYRGVGLFGFLGRYLINPENRVLDILDTSHCLLVKTLFYVVKEYYKTPLPATHQLQGKHHATTQRSQIWGKAVHCHP